MNDNYSLLGIESLSLTNLDQVQKRYINSDLWMIEAMFKLLMVIFSVINFFFLKHFFYFLVTVFISIFISSFTYNIYRLILINSFTPKLNYNNSKRSNQLTEGEVSTEKQYNILGNIVKYLFLSLLGFYFAFELVFQLLRFTNKSAYEMLTHEGTIIGAYSYLIGHLSVLNTIIFIIGLLFLLFPQLIVDLLSNKTEVKNDQFKKHNTICQLDTDLTKQKIEQIKENWKNSKRNEFYENERTEINAVKRNCFHYLQDTLINF